MSFSDSVVIAHQRRERHTFRRGESGIVTGAMFAVFDLFAVLVFVLFGVHMANKLLTSARVLPLGKSREGLLVNRTFETPFFRQFAKPLAVDTLVFAVVTLSRVGVFRVVIFL